MNENIKQYFTPGKKNLKLIYGLYLGVIIFPLLPIIGAIFAFINNRTKNEIYKSHYVFASRSFYLPIIFNFVILSFTFIITLDIIRFFIVGVVLNIMLIVWFIVRSIVALKYLIEDQDYPNPTTWRL